SIGRLPDLVQQGFRKVGRRHVEDAAYMRLATDSDRRFRAGGFDEGYEAVELGVLWMAQVHRKVHLLGDGVDGTRCDYKFADGKTGPCIPRHDLGVQLGKSARRRSHRVATELERGGAGMRCLSLDRDLQPPGSLNPVDDADGNIGALQGWSLLDMKFEVTGYRKSERAHRSLRQRVQRGLQVVAEQFPVIASK